MSLCFTSICLVYSSVSDKVLILDLSYPLLSSPYVMEATELPSLTLPRISAKLDDGCDSLIFSDQSVFLDSQCHNKLNIIPNQITQLGIIKIPSAKHAMHHKMLA